MSPTGTGALKRPFSGIHDSNKAIKLKLAEVKHASFSHIVLKVLVDDGTSLFEISGNSDALR